MTCVRNCRIASADSDDWGESVTSDFESSNLAGGTRLFMFRLLLFGQWTTTKTNGGQIHHGSSIEAGSLRSRAAGKLKPALAHIDDIIRFNFHVKITRRDC